MHMSPELIIALTPILLAILGLAAQMLRLNSNTKDAVNEARQAKDNTANISNGFASGVGSKLDKILDNQNDINEAIRHHLEWHLHKETSKK